MSCALCDSDNLDLISTKDAKSNVPLNVVFCSHCGLVQQETIPTQEELRQYYSHEYRVEYKSTCSPKSKHVFRAAASALKRLAFLNSMESVSFGKLLDVGAGGGEFVYLAGRAGYDAEGIEPNVGYSDYAREEYGCRIEQGELYQITGQYDVITMFHVMEHLPSPLAAFQRAFESLNENGLFFVEVPWIESNDASPNNIFFKAHLFYFAVATLAACASQWFDVERVDTTSNLRVLFRRKLTPGELQLPDEQQVRAIRARLDAKGWGEYLVQGGGIWGPLRKTARAIAESSVRNQSGRRILDDAFLKRAG